MTVKKALRFSTRYKVEKARTQYRIIDTESEARSKVVETFPSYKKAADKCRQFNKYIAEWEACRDE